MKKKELTCKLIESENNDKNFESDKEMSHDKNKNNKISEVLTKTSFINNIEKPLEFHIENFKANNINWSYNKIKWNLQKIRKKKFPNDTKYLKDISKIRISFEKNNINLEEIPLCFKLVELINPEKKTNWINI